MNPTNSTLLKSILLVGMLTTILALPEPDKEKQEEQTLNKETVKEISSCLVEIQREIFNEGVFYSDYQDYVIKYTKSNQEELAQLHLVLQSSPVDIFLTYQNRNKTLLSQKENIMKDCNQSLNKTLNAINRPKCSQGIMKDTNFWQNANKYSYILSPLMGIRIVIDKLAFCDFIKGNIPEFDNWSLLARNVV